MSISNPCILPSTTCVIVVAVTAAKQIKPLGDKKANILKLIELLNLLLWYFYMYVRTYVCIRVVILARLLQLNSIWDNDKQKQQQTFQRIFCTKVVHTITTIKRYLTEFNGNNWLSAWKRVFLFSLFDFFF